MQWTVLEHGPDILQFKVQHLSQDQKSNNYLILKK